jgi:hypothetical protein
VVARDRDHGDAERLQARAKSLVSGATFVLHDVAGGDDDVRSPAAIPSRVLEHGQVRRVGRHSAHAAVGRCVQMRVADLQNFECRIFGALAHSLRDARVENVAE